MGSIRVTNLGKAYKQYTSRWSRLAEWVLPFTKARHRLKWVLQGVSFTVSPGEAVGIIGINGAGKSTLLKMLVGTTQPTTGDVEITGRVAALLELGMGFHPDFTGKQNVFMAGHLMGLNPREIAELMPEIEAFAEIGDYIDQHVRVYSSGMMVRLAFSVASAVRPEILIIDEALSVGDAYFQHKSFDRIREFRDKGTTLLFVSHDAGTIKTLCNRAILIDQGIVIKDDSPDTVLDYYNAMISKQQADFEIRQIEQMTGTPITRSGTGEARIESVDCLVEGESVRTVTSGDSTTLQVVIKAHEPMEELTIGILIRDRLGNDVFGTNTYYNGNSKQNINSGEKFTVAYFFPALRLGVGSYSVTVALHKGSTHLSANYDWLDHALVFQVILGAQPITIGVCNLPVSVSWQSKTEQLLSNNVHPNAIDP